MQRILKILLAMFTMISLCIMVLIIFGVLSMIEMIWVVVFAMLGFSVYCIKTSIEKDKVVYSEEEKKQNTILLESKISENVKDIRNVKVVMVGIFILVWLFVVFYV